MPDITYTIIEEISLLLGVLGVLIILVGALHGGVLYIFKKNDKLFREARLTLGSHMLLGLDFLVCKDLIDTLLLDSGAEFWRDLAGLSIIVCIRIVLSVMAQKEINELEKQGKK